jgi:hypothetical protein
MDPRRLNRTASSCRVGDWAVGGVQVVYAGAEGLPAKRVEDCLQSEDLTTMAHMEGSNPLAPTIKNSRNPDKKALNWAFFIVRHALGEVGRHRRKIGRGERSVATLVATCSYKYLALTVII